MKAIKSTGITLAILFLIGLSSGNSFAQTKRDTPKEYVKLHIYGMACPVCSYGVEKKIRELKGAENIHMDLKNGYATFDVPPSTKVTKAKMKRLVANAGFELKSAEFSDQPFNEARDGTQAKKN